MQTPDWVLILPGVNAALNGLATLLLVAGYLKIRQRRIRQHKKLMLSAFATSILFLVCYLAYHFGLHYYTGQSGRPFQGTGAVRTVYLTILITHVLLAMAVPFLASMTIWRAYRQDWERHMRIARVTFPIWLYVSVTGVIIYLMLYHWPES